MSNNITNWAYQQAIKLLNPNRNDDHTAQAPAPQAPQKPEIKRHKISPTDFPETPSLPALSVAGEKNKQRLRLHLLNNELVLLACRLAIKPEEMEYRQFLVTQMRGIVLDFCKARNLAQDAITLRVVGSHAFSLGRHNSGLDLEFRTDNTGVKAEQMLDSFSMWMKHGANQTANTLLNLNRMRKGGDGLRPYVQVPTRFGGVSVFLRVNVPNAAAAAASFRTYLKQNREDLQYPLMLVLAYYFESRFFLDPEDGGINMFCLAHMVVASAQREHRPKNLNLCDTFMDFLQFYSGVYQAQSMAIFIRPNFVFVHRKHTATNAKPKPPPPDRKSLTSKQPIQILEPHDPENDMTAGAWRWEEMRCELMSISVIVKERLELNTISGINSSLTNGVLGGFIPPPPRVVQDYRDAVARVWVKACTLHDPNTPEFLTFLASEAPVVPITQSSAQPPVKIETISLISDDEADENDGHPLGPVGGMAR
ncbi:uncharacterized protein EV422DRAFT_505897 [Fimicolochytrium jonesii]|uniref:uncharacterized protein n=1 Tax=Fimicolochytrium jonesii TaxID=1396493 RepID=UPI0022FF3313|nr:uncharacterized protein EV422DRAFT_505897 [Fimicolochytrium jonesii]KAI8821804.1 hypothetical protein EV422DRAFT_505897 [Fimicolochytrium jonesii]